MNFVQNVSLLFLLIFSYELVKNVSSDPQRGRRKELSDDEIIEALAILLSEVEDEESDSRRGRQGSFDYDYEEEEAERSGRRDRVLGRQDFEDVLGQCTTTGYEVRYLVCCWSVYNFNEFILADKKGRNKKCQITNLSL